MSIPKTTHLPIVAFALHPWQELQWMNRQHLLSRFAKRGWPIVYTTGALDLWHRESTKWQQSDWLSAIKTEDDVLIDCPGCWLPRWRKWKLWDYIALRNHAWHLKKAVNATGNRNCIAFLFHPWFWPYVEHLNPAYVVYHAYDVQAKQRGWTAALENMLAQLVENADLITASSESIARELPGNGALKARILYNGADVASFMGIAKACCPKDLAKIPSPRIAYVGSINRKVDLNLITEIAEKRLDWNWILIGNIDELAISTDSKFNAALSKCIQYKNIHFLGEKSHLKIPRYANNMDVNTMCYRTDLEGWWSFGYPLKLHEYLATGKPVVSIDLETVIPFSNVIDIARTPDEWITAIEKALMHGGVGNAAERRAVAMDNSWDKRVDLLEQWLLKMIASN